MNGIVFRMSPWVSIGFPALFLLVFPAFVMAADAPWWVLLFCVIPVIFMYAAQKSKVIVGMTILRYEALSRGKEVPLIQVAKISIREEIGYSDGKQTSTTKVYVFDEKEQLFFSFSHGLIGNKKWEMFKQAVLDVNPEIVFD